MAAFDGSDLRRWREQQGISSADLAERINCDVTTLSRYYSGKIKPNPDVMYQICRELGDTRRWMDWMRTEYPASYGRMHPESLKLGMEGTIMTVFSEIRDVIDLERQLVRDGADGKIDNMALLEKSISEVTELIQALESAKSLLEAEKESGKSTKG